MGRVKLPAPGQHNVYNALAAMSVGHLVGMDFQDMFHSLTDFQLPQRRFQVLRMNGSVVIDDYAHLPKEIEVTLSAIRNGWQPGKIMALFQPHRFSRTKHINGQFGSAFEEADEVIVTGIYPAFERPIPGITSDLIYQSIKKSGSKKVRRILDREEILDYLKSNLKKGDFVVGLGAGDIWKVTEKVSKINPA